jgi:hypothetical protein
MMPSQSKPTQAAPSAASSKIRLYRTMYGAMDELRTEIKKEHQGAVRWKKRFTVLGFAAVIVLSGVVAAISATQNTHYGISGETYTYDTSIFTLTSQGHSVAGAGAAAVGTTNSLIGAIESAPASAGVANTALTAGHWVYQAKIDEASINSFTSLTAYYKVELFLDGNSQGAVYVKNTVLDVLNAEGVTIKWSLGASLPATGAYVIKVNQMAA